MCKTVIECTKEAKEFENNIEKNSWTDKKVLTRIKWEERNFDIEKTKLKLQNDHNLTVSKTQLWQTLHQIGCVYKENSGNNREVMCERSDLVSKKCDYLKKIQEYIMEGQNLVFFCTQLI